jgi:hypothetical protein
VSLRGGGITLPANSLAPLSVPSSFWNCTWIKKTRRQKRRAATTINSSVFPLHSRKKKLLDSNLVTSVLIARYKIRLFLVYILGIVLW